MSNEIHPFALASREVYKDEDGSYWPVIIEFPEFHTFDMGEREWDWRPATIAEIDQYHDYYANEV